jgi:hypothetical protein
MTTKVRNSPSLPLGAEKVGVRWGNLPLATAAHLTLAAAKPAGPLPLPPEGGEGERIA